MKNLKSAIVLSCFISSSALATSLTEALVNTYQNNPELIAAREQLKTTDEKMFKAVANFLPSIQYSASKVNQKQDTTSATDLNGFRTGQQIKTDDWVDSKIKKSTVELKQNVFNGGQSVMAVRIAKYTIDAGRQDLLQKEQDVLIKAIQAYLDVIRTKNVLEISKENYISYEKKYVAVKDKLEVGVAKQADLADASARKANAATSLTVAQGRYSAAIANYVQVIGIEPDSLSSSGEKLIKIPANELDLMNKALANNPQILNATYQKKIADLSVTSTAAAMLPSVDVGGTIGKNWQDTRGANISQPYTNSKSVFVSVTVPIYSQGLEYSNIRSSSAEAARWKYILKNTKSSITQSVVATWTEYVSAQEAVKSAQEAVKAGLVALDSKQQEYDEGLGTLTELLEIQENLFEYKLRLEQAKEDAILSYYKVSGLMGKLNAKDLSLPTKIYNPAENFDKVKLRLIGL